MNPVFSSRHKTESVRVGDGNKSVMIGGASPIVVQSMTNTATEDVDKTVQQIRELAEAGSELVRMTYRIVGRRWKRSAVLCPWSATFTTTAISF